MRHNPILVEETRGWFAKARNDLRAATVDLQAVPPLLEDAMFHSQQAVEKTLKGFLTWHDEPFRKTHSLAELGEQCARLDLQLEPLLRKASRLSEYATKYRYPGEPLPATPEDAVEAMSLAENVVEAVLARLPSEASSA